MARRKRRQPRSAYLKKRKAFYDPYSPYALRMRGAKSIRLSDPIPQSQMESEERKAAKALALIWQAERHQKQTEFHRIVLMEIFNPDQTLREGHYIFWHNDDYYVYHQKGTVQRRSIRYGRDRAFLAWENSQVKWAATYEIPPPSAPS